MAFLGLTIVSLTSCSSPSGARVDDHGRARRHLGAQDEVGERILDEALDRAPQRPGAHRRIPALLDEQVLGLLGELELELALGHRLADPQQQQLDDLLDLVLAGQLVEDDHVVDPVEELGPEDLLELAHDPVLHVVVGDPGLVVGDREAERRVARDLGGPDVRGHDHDGVAEVDGAALRVGQPPVLEDLQQDVEDVGCAFSISSSSSTQYGLRRTASVSWPPSS